MYQEMVSSLLSGLIGALLGGLITYLSTCKANKNNIELAERKEKREIRSVVLSIANELTSLLESYEEEMDNLYINLPNNNYLEWGYTITQDFMTIYNNNANKIGLIENDKIRILIIQCYTHLKKYIEYLLNYEQELKSFNCKRNSFIGYIYPQLINIECATANTTLEISYIKEQVSQDNWDHLLTGNLNEIQIRTFIKSDNQAIEDLIYFSQDLKEKYFELKKLFKETIAEIAKHYNNI